MAGARGALVHPLDQSLKGHPEGKKKNDRNGTKHAAERGQGLTGETLSDFTCMTDFGVLTLTHDNVINICFQLRLGGSNPT